MIPFVAFATLLQSPIKVGMDLATVGKVYPSHYRAVVDPIIMPKLDRLSAKKRETFSGQLFVRNFYPNGADRMLPLKEGHVVIAYQGVDVWNDKKITTIAELLAILPKNSDVRYDGGKATIFFLDLPAEVKKLDGFCGWIQPAPTKHLYSDFQLTIKDGKVDEVRSPGV